MIIGHLDQINGKKISGWLGSFSGDVTPFLTANDKPCLILSSLLPRPDVAEHTGLGIHAGFIAELPHLPFGEIELALYAITFSGKKKLIEKRNMSGASISPRRFLSVFDAVEIAKHEDSVAITCWEGTHNPIGRAQALYNVVKTRRPAVIVAFDMGFSDQGLWLPLISSDINVLMIPWQERADYFELFKKIGLSFNTIWICKPCYPSFELSRHIANEKTCFVQDIDDNEFEFSKAEDALTTPYGKLSNLMAQRFLANIPQRSVASVSLQQSFGGKIVRHARNEVLTERHRATDLSAEIRVGFIGTVRPHKGVTEAARALNFINRQHGYHIKFVVGGAYEPAHLADELTHLGSEVHSYINQADLNSHLENLDVVIAGFPDSRQNANITKYQISSKIGDALGSARPVLVPITDSVADLQDVPGIFLFNEDTFIPQLLAAIAFQDQITLPSQFKLEENYEIFADIESQAKASGPNFRELFGYQHDPLASTYKLQSQRGKNVVLVWKQHDAGLYGRRVDQVARSLTCNIDIHNVTVLEIVTPVQQQHYKESAHRIDSDKQFVYADIRDKLKGKKVQGVLYKTLLIENSEAFTATFNRFLLEEELYPDNTAFVLFPAVTEYVQLLRCINGYKTICDVVDNQVSWDAHSPLPLLSQYATINQLVDKVIFNSAINMQFFTESGLCDAKKASLIPNWYTLPADFKTKTRIGKKKVFDILYSGNMNDRIDWNLLKAIHTATSDSTRIHLVGSADRMLDMMTDVIEHFPKFIYHGPMRECDLLRFSSNCDLAVMPHMVDEFSTFMNPMKLHMYTALGLHCISTDVPGIDGSNKHVTICKSHEEFLRATLLFIENPERNVPDTNRLNSELPRTYLREIMSLFQTTWSQ